VRALLALVVGVMIYSFTRDGLAIHAWLGVHGHIAAPDVIRYQLPDALWEYAFCVTVLAIWRRPWAIAIPLVLGLAAECLVGTFDPRDVIALLLGAYCAQLTPYAPPAKCRKPSLSS
jgi:hypothetical protein